MSRVVVLAHDGVKCALPASQVVHAMARTPEGETLTLFRQGGGAPGGEKRSILVRTPAGERWVACSEARFEWMPETGMFPVPELLRDAMGLPHVVGVAEREGDDWIWLLDLERLVDLPARLAPIDGGF